ncbi:Rrf2 family transcriptional regulator [Flaviaesturariibacter amylovorans]|uniref:Rrf2 family transcriptional regulator n=1 Tax=Flaviaesturariibacter amylovorans TaxID=1084520 RepID=A0ABP8H5W3_9BACT
MLFSKSFGYAIRGILYIATSSDSGAPVQTEAIARELGVPMHFTRKVLKQLAQKGILVSSKGQRGGFLLAEGVLEKPLIELVEATDGVALFHTCILRLRACDHRNPCPMHEHFKGIQDDIRTVLSSHTIGGLLSPGRAALLRSLMVEGQFEKFAR